MEDYEVYDYMQDNAAAEPEAVYTLNSELSLAGHIINDTGANLFLTGKAGTGKTTFLRRLRETSGKRMIVLAPTGVAAINAEGVTIHSFFQLGFSTFIPGKGYADSSSKRFSFGKEKRRIISTLDLIVIDEISMVRPDVLDAMDDTLRRIRGSGEPFGGVQLLLIGDLRQLAPVVRDYEWSGMDKYYKSPYFFESHALKKAGFLTIELQTVYRQSDQKFIDILNAVREGEIDDATLHALNGRYVPGFEGNGAGGYIHLTTHNGIANSHNYGRLNMIQTEPCVFHAKIEGEFPESSYPADASLALKTGAQVMFIKNDQGSNRRFYNGLIGTVTDIGENTVTVLPADGGEPIETGYMEWENTKYSINPESGEIESETAGKFSQIPLRLAWAITIHKSQGLTFDRAIIDAVNSFAPGQTYVALSRCRSLEGLVLSSPIRRESVITDSHVNAFISSYETSRPDGSTLTSLKKEYTRSVVAEMFDFNAIRRSHDQFTRAMREYVVPVFDKLGPTVEEEYMRVMKKIVDVASKFKVLYASAPIDPDTLSRKLVDKIQGGCWYFADELDATLRYIGNLDFELDNRTFLTRLNNAADELIFRVKLKRDILRNLGDKTFSTAEYNKAKTKAMLDNESGNTGIYSSKRKKKASESKPKKPKGYSQHLSLTLFKEGWSMTDIAKDRKLSVATIAGHLGYFVAKGDLDISDLVPTENLKLLEEAYADGKGGYAALKELADRIPHEQISVFYRSRTDR